MTSRFLRANLHLKIMAALVVAFLPIVLFAGVLPLRRERDYLVQQDSNRAKDLLRTLAAVAEVSRGPDHEPFRTIIGRAFAEDHNVVSIRMLDRKGTVLAQAGPRTELPSTERWVSGQRVYTGGQDVGQVELVYSLSSSREAVDAMRGMVLFTVVDCILFLGFLLHLVLRKVVTAPLSELTRLAGLVAAGDLTQRMNDESGDELGVVAKAFNGMQDSLSRSRADLEQAKNELEDRVRERTAQLAREVQKVQRAERLSTVGTLAAGIAHELNNPIGNISTFSQLLLERENPAPDFLKKSLTTIATETQRAHRIIQGLLDFSRQSPGERKELNLADVVESALKIAVPANSSRAKYVVDTAIATDAKRVNGDFGQLQQVFINILNNAFQAMPEGGRVSVKLDAQPVERQGAMFVVCEVADSGPGIAEEDLPRLFDPFFTTKQVGAGTGLGLSVSYGILQDHGGVMEVRSERGNGAVFSVLLPVMP